jgi:hypothetical protein
MPGSSGTERSGRQRASAKEGAADFFQTVLAYVKQETLDPVLAQLKLVVVGVAGALVMAMGTVLLAVGFVRALQSEFGGVHPLSGLSAYAPLAKEVGPTVLVKAAPYGVGGHLSGSWSWVPYMGGALLCVLVAAFSLARALKGRRP